MVKLTPEMVKAQFPLIQPPTTMASPSKSKKL